MTSTQWCDVSEFQRVVDDSYPYRWLAFRSNDGTYRDRAFSENYAWCISAITRGRLDGFIVYAVYEPDAGRWVDTLMSMVGTPHPRMVVMIDVESWGGRISGDHSNDINVGCARIVQWLGASARVIGYGNAGDLNNLWPHRGNRKVVLAAYGSNPPFLGKIAHQYTSQGNVPPFGYPVDLNSADGYTSQMLLRAFGLNGPDLASVGGSTPLEDDMTPAQAAQLNAIAEALFGPVTGGASGPLSWTELDKSVKTSRYGVLSLALNNQTLIAKLADQVAALSKQVADLTANTAVTHVYTAPDAQLVASAVANEIEKRMQS